MTLRVAFIHNWADRKDREELAFAFDSRPSCGQRIDHGQKFFGLPRAMHCLLLLETIEQGWKLPLEDTVYRSLPKHYSTSETRQANAPPTSNG